MDTESESQTALTKLSEWIDAGLPGRSPETMLLHRVIKVSEENGEAVGKLIGALGANPRKGVTNGMDAVVDELLDAAISALGAVEHILGNNGRALGLLDQKIIHVAERAGVVHLTDSPKRPTGQAIEAIGAAHRVASGANE